MTGTGVMIKMAHLSLWLVVSVQSVMACDVPEGWLKMQSKPETKHILWIQPDDAAYQQGQRFGADIIVCTDNLNTLVEEISIDAIMPAHKHGMNYLPDLIPNDHNKQLRASGLFFHMSGEWQITVTLTLSAEPERHMLTLNVK